MKYKVKKIIEGICCCNLEAEHNLLDDGILDSLRTMNLVLELERYFNITIDTDEFNHENFNSVNAITAIVDTRQKECIQYDTV